MLRIFKHYLHLSKIDVLLISYNVHYMLCSCGVLHLVTTQFENNNYAYYKYVAYVNNIQPPHVRRYVVMSFSKINSV